MELKCLLRGILGAGSLASVSHVGLPVRYDIIGLMTPLSEFAPSVRVFTGIVRGVDQPLTWVSTHLACDRWSRI